MDVWGILDFEMLCPSIVCIFLNVSHAFEFEIATLIYMVMNDVRIISVVYFGE